jgi:hypothetical protein
MLNCQNCRHWSLNEKLSGLEEGWRECRMGRGEVEPKGKKGTTVVFHPRSLMRAHADGGAATVVTGALFSCQHWDGAL